MPWRIPALANAAACSMPDAGVGAMCARTAVLGAYLNVKINAGDLEDREFVNQVLEKGEAMKQRAMDLETAILQIVEEKI